MTKIKIKYKTYAPAPPHSTYVMTKIKIKYKTYAPAPPYSTYVIGPDWIHIIITGIELYYIIKDEIPDGWWHD